MFQVIGWLGDDRRLRQEAALGADLDPLGTSGRRIGHACHPAVGRPVGREPGGPVAGTMPTSVGADVKHRGSARAGAIAVDGDQRNAGVATAHGEHVDGGDRAGDLVDHRFSRGARCRRHH